jgi:hypothetical protein
MLCIVLLIPVAVVLGAITLALILASGWKWLDGLQKHEQRVSEGRAIAIKKPRKTQAARQNIL